MNVCYISYNVIYLPRNSCEYLLLHVIQETDFLGAIFHHYDSEKASVDSEEQERERIKSAELMKLR